MHGTLKVSHEAEEQRLNLQVEAGIRNSRWGLLRILRGFKQAQTLAVSAAKSRPGGLVLHLAVVHSQLIRLHWSVIFRRPSLNIIVSHVASTSLPLLKFPFKFPSSVQTFRRNVILRGRSHHINLVRRE